jgi:type IX secretion system PorP/SprF family membrane protein
MKKTHQNILIALGLLVGIYCTAQQYPQFTQYMYNHSIINPAYATASEGTINFGALYRTQWVGLEGAPKTGSFFAHTPINEKMEVGISFVNDNIGDVVTENNIFVDYAYILRLNETSKLSLGLKGGFTFFKTNFTDFSLQSGNASTDVAFNENISKTFPNVGLGTFYFTDTYYVGLSIPNLLTSKHIETENGIASTGVQDIHFFLTGGYVFDISQNLKFKPAFMTKAVKGAPLSIDLTANVLINNRIEAGLGYRIDDAVTGLVNFKVIPELRIGYAYDYTTTNLGDFNSGSHEIMILFDLDFLNIKKGFDRSPRFF